MARCELLSLPSVATLLLLLSLVSYTGQSLTFAVIGDWGLGGYNAGWFPEIRSANAHNRVCETMGCNFTLSVGDNIYVGNTVLGLQDSFQGMFSTNQPFFPTLGNHDNAGPQLEYTKTNKRWKFPAPTYTYEMPLDDTGYTVQIFAVNSNDGGLGGGGQYAWLEGALKASTARWKIIFGHFPTVGSGRHRRSGSVSRIHSLMKTYNAQAYFCGHDHILEMSNEKGRVLGISGAMARGGMMLRGIGGQVRRFTLTHPSEYNTKWMQDWPAYGLITVRLSPNVMNVQLWDHYEALQYDFSVTHDWMTKVDSLPDAAKDLWPPADVVLQAYKDEVNLPKGPGGGQIFEPNGDVIGTTTTQAPVDPTASTTTLPPKDVKNDVATDKTAVHSGSNKDMQNIFLKYSVSTECIPCNSTVTLGYPFSIYVMGTSATSLSRLFLTTSPIGCENRDKADFLAGTDIVSMKRNVVTFTAKKEALPSAVFVCYSGDQGKSYTRLSQFNSFTDEPGFVIRSADPNAPKFNSTLTNSDAPTQAPPPAPTSAPAPVTSSSGGHSTTTLVLVVFCCVAATAVGTVYYVRSQQQSSGRGRRRRRHGFERMDSGATSESGDDDLATANEPAPAVRGPSPAKKRPASTARSD